MSKWTKPGRIVSVDIATTNELINEIKRLEEEKETKDLRDYFAAKALQGQLSTAQDLTWEQYASDAYRMADAMLKAREA